MGQIISKNFKKQLSEVLSHPTEEITKTSAKTGNEYVVEAVKELTVYAVSSPVEKNGKYSYSITDPKNDLEYSITAPNRVEAKFGVVLKFTNVTGGLLDSGIVWFSADSVAVVQRNA